MNQKIKIENMPELPYAVEEAINRLRVNMSFIGNKVRKIMVISTFPNEGKSFVAMQLWHQMAITGTKSILLDADLRKSVMAEKYGLSIMSDIKGKEEKIKGTSYVLSNDDPLEDAFYHTEYENGDILPNIDNVINPSILLESDRFQTMLDYMAKEYRYVFIDTPPLELVSDGEKIGSLCDGAVLVVRGGSTSKHMVRNSIRQLERAGCPLLGIVLNRVEGAKGGYYYKKYGSKYYYGNKYYGRYSDDPYYYNGSSSK